FGRRRSPDLVPLYLWRGRAAPSSFYLPACFGERPGGRGRASGAWRSSSEGSAEGSGRPSAVAEPPPGTSDRPASRRSGPSRTSATRPPRGARPSERRATQRTAPAQQELLDDLRHHARPHRPSTLPDREPKLRI